MQKFQGSKRKFLGTVRTALKHFSSIPNNRARGFTLIEMIFSLLLISIALVVYASSLSLSGLIQTTRYRNIAYHSALRQVEILRNTDFLSLPAGGPFSDSGIALLPSGSGQITVVDEDIDLRRFQVSVSWNENGGPKSVNFETLIYEKGINAL